MGGLFFRLLMISAAFLAAALQSSSAQAQSTFPPIADALWVTVLDGQPPAGFYSPDEACRAQWQSYNPNAIYQPPTEYAPDRQDCHWLGKQDGVDAANTILPVSVLLRCPSIDYELSSNGQCIYVYGRRAPCNCETSSVSSPHPTLVGDPIDLQSGTVTETHLDYATADGQFTVERHYWSGTRGVTLASTSEVAGFGSNWHGLLPGHIIVSGGDYSQFEFISASPGVAFFNTVNAFDPASVNFAGIDPNRARLTLIDSPPATRAAYFTAPENSASSGEIRLDFPNGDYLLFRRAGALTTDSKRYLVPVEHHLTSGYTRFFDYNANALVPWRVRDSFGRQMQISWQGAQWTPPPACQGQCVAVARNVMPHISQITLPDGTLLNYGYDTAGNHVTGSGTNDRLISMQHVTSTGVVLAARTYLYENVTLPYALTGILDKDGVRINNFAYDTFGLATLTEVPGGANRFQVTNVWTDDSNLGRMVTNPLGFQTTYAYNRNWWSNASGTQPRHLTQITTAATPTIAAQTHSYTFDADRFVEYVDARGIVLQATNDPAGRPTQIREARFRPESRTSDISWHPVYDLPLTETLGNLRREYTYDAQMRISEMRLVDLTTQTIPYSTNGQSRAWAYTWNGNGRLQSINGPRPVNAQGKDDTLTFAYDTAGNLTSITNGLGQVTGYSNYDANGRPGRMTDMNGANTDFVYDSLGRVTTITARDVGTGTNHAVTTIEYDNEGRVTWITRPATARLGFAWDIAGRLTSIIAPNGESIAFTYDAMGNVTRERTLDAAATAHTDITRTFDGLGRMLTETLGVGRTIGFTYDAQGNVTQVMSPRNHATNQAFDGLARLTGATAPDTGTTASGYDQNDNVTAFTDAASVSTQFVYNGFGEVIQEVSPDRGTSTYEYDAAGDLLAVTDGRGQRVNYTRDILGRVLTRTPLGLTAQAITYSYDTASIAGSYSVGRLATVTDASGTTKFKYDHRGNVVQRTQTIASTTVFTLSYSYDLADRIISMVYPSGRIVNYTRDVYGRVSSVTTRQTATAALVTLLSAATYEPFGALSGASLGNTQTLIQQWSAGLLTAKRYRRSNNTNFWANSYTYDGDDNIATLTDEVTAANSRTFTYNSVDRLTRVDLPTGTTRREDYVFDTNDNRIRVERRALPSDVNPAATDTYNRTAGTNRLATVVTSAGTRSYTYDNRGNTSAESRPGSISVTTGYDGYGRLTSYTRTGTSNLAMTYNGLDQRVGLTTGTVLRRFVQDASGRMLGDYSTTGPRLFTEYIWLLPEVGDSGAFGGDDGTGGWGALAVVTANGAGGTQTLRWVHTNHLGTPVATTSNTGASSALPTTSTLLGFPGQTQTLADLYYNQYRDYDPTTGRYIQADPIGLNGDINPYAYANGNPVNATDPMGLFSCGFSFRPGSVECQRFLDDQREAIDAVNRNLNVLNRLCRGGSLSQNDRSVYNNLRRSLGARQLEGANLRQTCLVYRQILAVLQSNRPAGQPLDIASRCDPRLRANVTVGWSGVLLYNNYIRLPRSDRARVLIHEAYHIAARRTGDPRSSAGRPAVDRNAQRGTLYPDNWAYGAIP